MTYSSASAVFRLKKSLATENTEHRPAPKRIDLFLQSAWKGGEGDTGINTRRTLRVVGTRRVTSYGRDLCREIISVLPGMLDDLVIVIGLAYGIDVIVHRDAWRGILWETFSFTKSMIFLEIRFSCKGPYIADRRVQGLEVVLPGTRSSLPHVDRRTFAAT